MTCARCSHLEEQIAYWKSEATASASEERIGAIALRHGLSRQEAWIVGALAEAKTPVLPRKLANGMPGRMAYDRADALNTCRVLIHRIRRKGVPVEFVRGVGYRLG